MEDAKAFVLALNRLARVRIRVLVFLLTAIIVAPSVHSYLSQTGTFSLDLWVVLEEATIRSWKLVAIALGFSGLYRMACRAGFLGEIGFLGLAVAISASTLFAVTASCASMFIASGRLVEPVFVRGFADVISEGFVVSSGVSLLAFLSIYSLRVQRPRITIAQLILITPLPLHLVSLAIVLGARPFYGTAPPVVYLPFFLLVVHTGSVVLSLPLPVPQSRRYPEIKGFSAATHLLSARLLSLATLGVVLVVGLVAQGFWLDARLLAEARTLFAGKIVETLSGAGSPESPAFEPDGQWHIVDRISLVGGNAEFAVWIGRSPEGLAWVNVEGERILHKAEEVIVGSRVRMLGGPGPEWVAYNPGRAWITCRDDDEQPKRCDRVHLDEVALWTDIHPLELEAGAASVGSAELFEGPAYASYSLREWERVYLGLEHAVTRERLRVDSISGEFPRAWVAWPGFLVLAVNLVIVRNRVRAVWRDGSLALGTPWIVLDGRRGIERLVATAWGAMIVACVFASVALIVLSTTANYYLAGESASSLEVGVSTVLSLAVGICVMCVAMTLLGQVDSLCDARSRLRQKRRLR